MHITLFLQARASHYSHIAKRLASWGFLVLQYNAPPLTIIPDAYEMPLLGDVISWLKQKVGSESDVSLYRCAAADHWLVSSSSCEVIY